MDGADGADSPPWWRSAVVYQVYPRSFADSDGDGDGDLPGLTARLGHVADLGVDALWLSPFYPSPQADGGYDIADHCGVDPAFGTLDDVDVLVRHAHDLGLRIMVDLVPNHSSSAHPAFRAALAAPPGSPQRAMYLFREGRGEHGELPPNDWQSMFTGPAWTRVTEPDGRPGQWYLHLFDAAQPDWDWSDPAVRDLYDRVITFWLDRGVDGLRVDVCDAIVKDPAVSGWPYMAFSGPTSALRGPSPVKDQEGIHEVFRRWRSLLETYGGQRILCAEAWLPPERTARIVRGDEMHQAFNFAFLETAWRADDLREVVTASLAAHGAVGAPTTWVLSNHDAVRHTTRFGYPPGTALPQGIGAGDPQPDTALGLRRARAATLVMLALPGAAYLYQGEELGLPEVTDLPDQVRQDPTWRRSGGTVRGRDGCRVPMPWSAGAPGMGFSPSGATWLPQPGSFAPCAVDAQTGVAGSTLETYRSALALRRRLRLGEGTLRWCSSGAGDAPGVLCAVRRTPVGQVLVVANTSGRAVPLPPGEVLLASGPVDAVGAALPGDTTVWLAPLETHRTHGVG